MANDFLRSRRSVGLCQIDPCKRAHANDAIVRVDERIIAMRSSTPKIGHPSGKLTCNGRRALLVPDRPAASAQGRVGDSTSKWPALISKPDFIDGSPLSFSFNVPLKREFEPVRRSKTMFQKGYRKRIYAGTLLGRLNTGESAIFFPEGFVIRSL